MTSTNSLIRRWAAAGAAALLTTTALIPTATAEDERRGSPTMLVLDSSGSMTADDAGGQTRIDAARDAAHTLHRRSRRHPRPRPRHLRRQHRRHPRRIRRRLPRHHHGHRPGQRHRRPDQRSHRRPRRPRLHPHRRIPPHRRRRTPRLRRHHRPGLRRHRHLHPTPVCEVAEDLADQGVDIIIINTVGFNVDDAAREELECIADAAGGTYADASDADTLADELKRAATRGYRAYQSDAERIPAAADDLKADTVPLDTTTLPHQPDTASTRSHRPAVNEPAPTSICPSDRASGSSSPRRRCRPRP
ncbi:VWA domain-containing protein [Corynebacterium suedekumii]|nr:VWA domain-containing protein [Corynebacterium suedekumii]